MLIDLLSLPEKGLNLSFSRKTGELNEDLADLIGAHDYKLEISLVSKGPYYELTGQLSSTVPELCSHCGSDIAVGIECFLNEWLMPEKEWSRTAKSVRGNKVVDFLSAAPGVSSYRGHHFNLSEFIHEAIAFETPLYPTCLNDRRQNLRQCRDRQKILKEQFQKSDDNGNPAFEILGKLKF